VYVRALLALVLLVLLAFVPAAGAQRPYDPDLWATVNVCDTPDHPGALGIRVSVPPRFRGESQWTRVRVEWWDGASGTWKLVRAGADTGWRRVGKGRKLVQSGTTFTFDEPAQGRWLIVRGLVDVQWRRHGHMTGTARTRTMPGRANPANPLLAMSHGACAITR
jgi:hypothetical protein